MLITEATRAALTRDFGGFEPRPPVPMKGKREEVVLWAPRAIVTGAEPAIVPAAVVID
jgi:hypothetical protein